MVVVKKNGYFGERLVVVIVRLVRLVVVVFRLVMMDVLVVGLVVRRLNWPE